MEKGYYFVAVKAAVAAGVLPHGDPFLERRFQELKSGGEKYKARADFERSALMLRPMSQDDVKSSPKSADSHLGKMLAAAGRNHRPNPLWFWLGPNRR